MTIFEKSKQLLKFMIALAMLWSLGLIVFYSCIPDNQVPEPPQVDAFIILTGGKNRIEEGVKLFAESESELLLISGMESDFAIENVRKMLLKVKLQNKTVVYGKIADSTLSNAMESQLFITLHRIKSALIITSNYHIPRVKYVFSELIQDVDFSYYPVFSDKFIKSGDSVTLNSLILVIKEYNKFIGSAVLINWDKAEAMWNRGTVAIARFIRSQYS